MNLCKPRHPEPRKVECCAAEQDPPLERGSGDRSLDAGHAGRRGPGVWQAPDAGRISPVWDTGTPFPVRQDNIGRNINQLAAAANSTGAVDAGRLAGNMALLGRIRDRLDDVLDNWSVAA